MVTDIVREVAGDQAQVRGLIGEGGPAPSTTRDDVARLLKADVVFYPG
jgi:ABC-type Zn uptake system ZnuABC Zn-binding protein ZnuA